MAQYKWLTASDDAYPGAHDNPPLGVDTIGVLADDMRKVSTVKEARELRDELTAWLINHPNRSSGVGIFGNVQSYQAIALGHLQTAISTLDTEQQQLWVKALDDPDWTSGR